LRKFIRLRKKHQKIEHIIWIIFVFFINLTAILIFPILKKTKRFISLNKNKKENLKVWFHCSSVGEFLILKELIPIYKKKYKLDRVLISTFSNSSNILTKNFFYDDEIILFPLDIPIFHKRIIDQFNIKKIIIAETEIWPFMLYEAYIKKVEVIFVNGLITDSSFPIYSRISKIYPYFYSISKVITKSDLYDNRWTSLGVENVISGFDIKISEKLEEFDIFSEREKLKFQLDAFIPILVSIREGEEDLFLSILECSTQIIVVPRHTSKTMDTIISFCDENSIDWVRSSYVDLEFDSYNDYKVIIVDEFGVMDQFYKVASCAFVGGTISDIGGHNILEPLKYKLPTSCGMSTYNQVFAEKLAKKFNLLHKIQTREEFSKVICNMKVENKDKLNSALNDMINYIKEKKIVVFDNI